jgi:hypothetical protein
MQFQSDPTASVEVETPFAGMTIVTRYGEIIGLTKFTEQGFRASDPEGRVVGWGCTTRAAVATLVARHDRLICEVIGSLPLYEKE